MTNINIFGDAVSHGGLVELYREAYEELEREFPHLTGHLALYFDNDPRSLKEVVSGYYAASPDLAEFCLPRLTEAMEANHSSLVGTFPGDDGTINGAIIIRDVADSFDPAKQEELMWGSVAKRPGFPLPNPPLNYPEGFGFWSDFYHELGNHLHAIRNIDRYKAGTVSGLEKEMFADTFATFALYKRYGTEVLPILKHFSNVRTLEVALKASQDYYTSPAILEAMDRIMDKKKKYSGFSLQQLEQQAVPIVNKTMSAHKDAKAFAAGVEPLNDPRVQAVLLISAEHGAELLRAMGLNNYAVKYTKAVNDILALHQGGAPYSRFEPS
ncbi:MAG: hypothetical protein IPH06_13420 [Alphaproteobacteria bacterium]|jgi:hypothetical protein|nr:hypothetical protein [Alphaproteobacteria bacterium]QQS56453.1 MAG: hypothetical protein IPN28_09175 [Alphaproteobacteria bacterium]